MKKSTWMSIPAAMLSAGLMMAAGVQAQEHPEHPKESMSSMQHPKNELTMTALSQAIKDYVAQDSKIKGGYFLVYDPQDKKTLQLKLSKVHEDKLASLGGDVYFACVDCTAPDNTIYDLDIFMKKGEKDLVTTDISVHKINGAPRYTWKEDGGIWKKQPVAAK